MIMLLDADSAIHSSCYCSKEEDPEGYVRDLDEALAKFDEKYQSVVNYMGNTHGIEVREVYIFVQGKINFRNFINPNYKSNRKDKETPPLLYELKSLIVDRFNEWEYDGFKTHTWTCNGVETDDTVASFWKAYKEVFGDDSCFIASLDKDYKQIPCWYFDMYWDRFGEFEKITELEASKFLWKQVLMGDAGDGYSGLKGVGAKGADKILKDCTSEYSMMSRVYREYRKRLPNICKARDGFRLNYMMAKLRDDVGFIPEVF